MTFHVLSVCTGNICRSPLIELLIAHHAGEQALDVRVSSAGTRARNGLNIHPETARLCRQHRIDPSGFASQLLTADMVRAADLVLAAESAQVRLVQELAPDRWKRVYTLREFATLSESFRDTDPSDLARRRRHVVGRDLDIVDPVDQPAEVFDHVGDEIAYSVTAVIDYLRRVGAE